MLTVRQALQLPVFEKTQLLAGENGVSNPISWVHTVDAPDAHYEYDRDGVLLLTSGLSLSTTPELQKTIIPNLHEKKFAGLVICTGQYLKDVPEEMRAQADELGFPIIISPPELLFINITEQLLEPIVNQQYALLQKSNLIYDQLTDLVLKGGNLSDLVRTMSRLLNRSILIEDTSLRVIAHVMMEPMDRMRRASILRERSAPRISERLLRAGIYEKLRSELRPVSVPPMSDVGMTLPRLVVPIVVDRDIYGYFWIINDREDTELVRMAAVHGATVAALIMFKERAVAEAEAALRGDFFDQLLDGAPDLTLLQDQARRLNFNLEKKYQVILIHAPPASGGNGRPLLRDVQDWIRTIGLQPLTVWHDDRVVIICEGRNAKDIANRMYEEMSHPARKMLIGIGRSLIGAEGIAKSYNEALESIRIAQKLNKLEGVRPFEELGLMHWLYHLPVESVDGNPFMDTIHDLAAHDKRRNTELVKTLEGYLDNGGSLVDTAVKLHIHRNTLVHRLKRIEELCDLDLKDPVGRMNLHVAVKFFRLDGDRIPTTAT
ncbi:MAG: PucR family transcriptional regulator ligand-binding domain-containing protein [Chloroflexota bacterium]